MKESVLKQIENHLIVSEANAYHVRVHMMAYEVGDSLDEYPERIVSIPMVDVKFAQGLEEVEAAVLNGAFKYGQNDFQAQEMRSVSVGDVVEVVVPHGNERYYARVAAMGFVEMNGAEVNEWASMSSDERFFGGYRK